MIHLYDADYKSCISCFECKKIGGKSYGHCAIKDSMSPLIEKLSQADGIIFGSPIYFHGITGKMRSFLERLLFPYSVYDNQYSSIAQKKAQTAFIYTMNVTEDVMKQDEYQKFLYGMEYFIEKAFDKPDILYANDTYQFNDYSKYKNEVFSEKEKRGHRERQFPIDRQNAFQIGISMAQRLETKRT